MTTVAPTTTPRHRICTPERNVVSTDSTPPRLWWDGSDFLYLVADEALASHRDRVPGFYRARTVEDIPDDAVELRPAAAPPLSGWVQDMRSMLGRWVEVTVQREPKVTQQGVLHDFSGDGEVRLRDDTGAFHWCWPNLACLKADRPTSPAVPETAALPATSALLAQLIAVVNRHQGRDAEQAMTEIEAVLMQSMDPPEPA